MINNRAVMWVNNQLCELWIQSTMRTQMTILTVINDGGRTVNQPWELWSPIKFKSTINYLSYEYTSYVSEFILHNKGFAYTVLDTTICFLQVVCKVIYAHRIGFYSVFKFKADYFWFEAQDSIAHHVNQTFTRQLPSQKIFVSLL